MFWNLLTESGAGTNQNPWSSWIIIGVVAVAFIVIFILNSRSQKKRQKEMEETLEALKPGCKVKTIGGICGIVVEICPEDNTFVLETGSEASGKCYLKFDKQAIYQTDAKKEVEAVKTEEKETPAEETKAESEEKQD
ncbi:MAG: preprotein translocase subunit YajC [Clostridia bacterium]|nr:preprotein translocase subunit YajC [Clostridia bacterium]